MKDVDQLLEMEDAEVLTVGITLRARPASLGNSPDMEGFADPVHIPGAGSEVDQLELAGDEDSTFVKQDLAQSYST